VSASERDGLLDLRPYMEKGPHVIYNIASAMRAYRMFRTLGLRHLLVINSTNHIVGIITRSELLPSHMTSCDGKSSTEGLTASRSTRAQSVDSPSSGGETGITLDALHNDDVY
jgi:chloride channel 7